MTGQPLKPCPFCGSATAPTLIMRSVSNHAEGNYADGGCGARGPYKSFPQEAIDAWNKRAYQSKDLGALRAFAQAVMDCWPDGWGSTNAPPKAVLRVLRPYLLDKVQP